MISNPIKKLVSENRYDEAFDKLLLCTKMDNHLHNLVLQLKSRYEKLKEDEISGIIYKKDYDIERNRIADSLIKISEKVNCSNRTHSIWGLIILGLLVVASLLIVVWNNTHSDNPVVPEQPDSNVMVNPPIDTPKTNETIKAKPTSDPKPIKPTIKFSTDIDNKDISTYFNSCIKELERTIKTDVDQIYTINLKSGIEKWDEENGKYIFRGGELKVTLPEWP